MIYKMRERPRHIQEIADKIKKMKERSLKNYLSDVELYDGEDHALEIERIAYHIELAKISLKSLHIISTPNVWPIGVKYKLEKGTADMKHIIEELQAIADVDPEVIKEFNKQLEETKEAMNALRKMASSKKPTLMTGKKLSKLVGKLIG